MSTNHQSMKLVKLQFYVLKNKNIILTMIEFKLAVPKHKSATPTFIYSLNVSLNAKYYI